MLSSSSISMGLLLPTLVPFHYLRLADLIAFIDIMQKRVVLI